MEQQRSNSNQTSQGRQTHRRQNNSNGGLLALFCLLCFLCAVLAIGIFLQLYSKQLSIQQSIGNIEEKVESIYVKEYGYGNENSQANDGTQPVQATNQSDVQEQDADTTESDLQELMDNQEDLTTQNNDEVDSNETTHVVEDGESLSVIGEHYNLTVAELMELNDFDDEVIFVGQEIKVE